ncbi:hypothetical protein QVD17_18170 [Tagetes erecta]|uniref:Uncharacterized protein n=1 Tax=Tagetes erecta TaxID=13708 RepID=A0AAD8NW43_TARER|nr:hypothetical protein QVD17_18170 [Tagetes erecta]
MVRAPCFDKNGIKKGAWSQDEDNKLRTYIKKHGHANWRQVPKFAGLSRCGKSCRLRWMNYLHPNMKHGNFTKEEEDVIIDMHNKLGNKWSKMATVLSGRSDNEIKNHWHTNLKNQVQDNQTMSKNKEYCVTETKASSSSESKCLVKNLNSTTQQEVEALLAVLSSSSTSESSPCSTGVLDSTVPSDVTQVSDTTKNTWIETNVSPDVGSFLSSNDNMMLFSPLGLADDQYFISQTYLQEYYMMDDMLLWST